MSQNRADLRQLINGADTPVQGCTSPIAYGCALVFIGYLLPFASTGSSIPLVALCAGLPGTDLGDFTGSIVSLVPLGIALAAIFGLLSKNPDYSTYSATAWASTLYLPAALLVWGIIGAFRIESLEPIWVAFRFSAVLMCYLMCVLYWRFVKTNPAT